MILNYAIISLIFFWIETMLTAWLPFYAVPSLIWIGIFWLIITGNLQKRWLWILFYCAWSSFSSTTEFLLVNLLLTIVFTEMLNFIYKKYLPNGNAPLLSLVGLVVIFCVEFIRLWLVQDHISYIIPAGHTLVSVLCFIIMYYVYKKIAPKQAK